MQELADTLQDTSPVDPTDTPEPLSIESIDSFHRWMNRRWPDEVRQEPPAAG